LGTVAREDDWLPVIHRGHRCDLSLFQLGLRLLDYLLTLISLSQVHSRLNQKLSGSESHF
jgi:hypothetical protein